MYVYDVPKKYGFWKAVISLWVVNGCYLQVRWVHQLLAISVIFKGRLLPALSCCCVWHNFVFCCTAVVVGQDCVMQYLSILLSQSLLNTLWYHIKALCEVFNWNGLGFCHYSLSLIAFLSVSGVSLSCCWNKGYRITYVKDVFSHFRSLVVQEGGDFRSRLLLGGQGVRGCMGFMRASKILLGKIDCSSFRR